MRNKGSVTRSPCSCLMTSGQIGPKCRFSISSLETIANKENAYNIGIKLILFQYYSCI